MPKSVGVFPRCDIPVVDLGDVDRLMEQRCPGFDHRSAVVSEGGKGLWIKYDQLLKSVQKVQDQFGACHYVPW